MADQFHEEAIKAHKRHSCFNWPCFAGRSAYIKVDGLVEKDEAAKMFRSALRGERKFGEGEWGAGSGRPALFLSPIAAKRRHPVRKQ